MQAFKSSFLDYEECILSVCVREREREGISCETLHELCSYLYFAGKCQLLWEIDETEFNSHRVTLSAT